MSARRCSLNGCRNLTLDLSGYCHQHRGHQNPQRHRNSSPVPVVPKMLGTVSLSRTATVESIEAHLNSPNFDTVVVSRSPDDEPLSVTHNSSSVLRVIGDSHLVVKGSGTVHARDRAKVSASDNVTLETYDQSTGSLSGGAIGLAMDNSTITARDNSNVQAFDKSTTYLHDESTAVVHDETATVIRRGTGEVETAIVI